jgi:hypothetical protein
MAATSDVASLTMTQSFVGGPTDNGSLEVSIGGIGWTFRGIIPGSTTEACTNEEKQI